MGKEELKMIQNLRTISQIGFANEYRSIFCWIDK